MSLLAYRSNTILPNSSGPTFGANWTVTAYEVGGQAASGSSGTSVALRAGHGFASSDKLLVESSGSINTATFRLIDSVSGDTLTLSTSLSVSAGDRLINLGPDTGTTSPNYDGSGITTYADMAGAGSAVTESRVTCNAAGFYDYWSNNTGVWELIRDSNGVPNTLLIDVFSGAEGLVVSSLPTASETYRGKRRTLAGGAGKEDIEHICLKGWNDGYAWIPAANGGDS